MTMPGEAPDGVQSVILLELGKLTAAVQVLNTKMDHLTGLSSDHETRLREGERDRAELHAALDAIRTEKITGRDLWARGVSGLAATAAVGSAIAIYLHK